MTILTARRFNADNGGSPKMLRHTVLLGKFLANQNLVESVFDVNRFHSGKSIDQEKERIKIFY